MILGILKLIIIIFFATAIIVGVGLFKLFNKVRDAAQQLGQPDNGNTARRQRRRHAHDEVVDTRGRRETDKKIFRKDEGEYVDFTEEKI